MDRPQIELHLHQGPRALAAMASRRIESLRQDRSIGDMLISAADFSHCRQSSTICLLDGFATLFRRLQAFAQRSRWLISSGVKARNISPFSIFCSSVVSAMLSTDCQLVDIGNDAVGGSEVRDFWAADAGTLGNNTRPGRQWDPGYLWQHTCKGWFLIFGCSSSTLLYYDHA